MLITCTVPVNAKSIPILGTLNNAQVFKAEVSAGIVWSDSLQHHIAVFKKEWNKKLTKLDTKLTKADDKMKNS